jgi:hypothetical protein
LPNSTKLVRAAQRPTQRKPDPTQASDCNGALSSIIADSLLASGSLTGTANLQQVILVQYALISAPLG